MKVEKRTQALKDVRGMNKVPGVIFGKTIVPVSIQIDEKELHATLSEFGYTKTFKIKLGKETHQVYIKEIQKDILNPSHFLNVKLQKVVAGDTIQANVPIHIIGKEEIDKPGVIIQIMSDSIDVEYPVGQGISNIEVDISNMKVGDTLHVSDLTLPEHLILHDDVEKILVGVSEVTYVEETEEETQTVESVVSEAETSEEE